MPNKKSLVIVLGLVMIISISLILILRLARPTTHQLSQNSLKDLQTGSISNTKLIFDDKSYTVYLFSQDQKEEIEKIPSCPADEGARVMTGGYQLIAISESGFVTSAMPIGELTLVENKLHDGKIRILEAPSITDRKILYLFQYGSCSIERALFFQITSNGKLNLLLFVDKDDTSSNEISVLAGIKEIRILDNSITSSSYSNVDGKYYFIEYQYEYGKFTETKRWQSLELPPEEPEQLDTSDWQTYRNEEYGFVKMVSKKMVSNLFFRK